MKTVIAGSRGIEDYDALCQAIKESGYTITEVISGCARGPDTLGEQWAKEYGVPVSRFPPDWKLGRGAGFIRNRKMAEEADQAIILWDGKSHGTANMMDNMHKLGKPVFVKVIGR